tara:strand:- start:29498 stop:30037 length:540 start_codon:yes stop_codon:yes gene_type:complete
MQSRDILKFWFEELKSHQWFVKDEDLDKEIKDRFSDIHAQAVTGELEDWRNNSLGRVAEIIVIDQFSRNIFRNQKESFLYDSVALVLAQEAITAKADQSLSSEKKAFLYMPFMHSESKLIHQTALELYSQEGLEYNLEFELKHKKIIDQFGRYPHRNEILGRESTPEEIEFLKSPDSSF